MATSRMTKDQLRDALNDAGVKTNAKLRKADLVKLYRETILDQEVDAVSPNDSLIGGFSSDEEEPMSLDTSYITRETNVTDLTNDEIFFKLKDLGESVGPILDSTRTIYERKLSRLLNDDEPDAKDISAFSADEAENDKDETDEYEIINEDLKTNGFTDKILEDGGHLQTKLSYQDKIEENNGDVVRIRRTHTVKTYTNEKTNGKSFIPPPPKKRNFALIGGISFAVLIILAVLVWLNFESATTLPTVVPPPPQQRDTVPSN